jgi:large subunit ribosomal protein L19
MALKALHKDVSFAVGDRVKVTQRIKEGEKKRLQAFDGMVIGIKGSLENTSFTVRRIGEAQIGIERIFPLLSPTIEKIEVIRKGGRGVKHAKLYYTRNKSKREIEKIYSRTNKKENTLKSENKSKTSKKPRKK